MTVVGDGVLGMWSASKCESTRASPIPPKMCYGSLHHSCILDHFLGSCLSWLGVLKVTF